MQKLRPILGFGPIGWIASCVLLTILIAALCGYDFQFHYIWLLGAWFGGDFMMWYFPYVHVTHSVSFQNPYFGLAGAGAAVVAIFVSPRRSSPINFVIICLWGLIRPVLLFYEYRWLVRFYSWVSDVPVDPQWARVEAWLCIELFTCLLLWLVTRSRLVLIVSAGATLAVFLFIVTFGPIKGLFYEEPRGYLLFTFWNGAIGGSLLFWAIRDRLATRATGICQHCGYDLRGTSHARCPECGQTNTPQIATTTANLVTDSPSA